MPLLPEHAGDLGQHARPIVDVEPQVKPAGDRMVGEFRWPSPTALLAVDQSFERAEGDRRAADDRVDQVGHHGRGGRHLAGPSP